ncbi:site-specific recombinase XerD [Aneurinibacillus soli]|uniref:Putative prophage phiRv2 integrase n=1 Tax=Aneurinibacillus soli TaxID=1500254 RepID=A0A0U4WKJ6_9BACL|nr:tyrosine-type recombinase/integrase [Aneurinibacillus soli]PYE62940.1 site-specific recombinase XerD [Aneurinibacillus soli]BAU29001.1 putative prophage phiRv2 integrase [Aneurinibacillus soli]
MKGYFRKRGEKWSFTLDIGRDHETGKRKQKTMSGFKTKKEAEKACAELILKIENGSYQAYSKDSFAEFMKQFMEMQKQSVRATTLETQTFMLEKHLLPAFGPILLRDIKPHHIQKFYTDKLEAGLSGSYVHTIHCLLNKALRIAYEWGLIEKNVATLVKPPRKSSKEMKVWNIDQIQHFLEVTKECRFHLAYLLGIWTGMRRGEILGLRWQDVDIENGILSVRQTIYRGAHKLIIQEPKTKGSRRTITFPTSVSTALRRHKLRQQEVKLRMGTRHQEHDLVIAHDIGTPVDPSELTRWFKHWTKKAELPSIRFHDLRHTHATILMQLGENPKIISERLGHNNISITLDTYSHVLPNMQRDLANKLEATLQKRPSSS